jgi:hypothetical protein
MTAYGIGSMVFLEDNPLSDERWATDPLGLTPYLISPPLWPLGLLLLIRLMVRVLHKIVQFTDERFWDVKSWLINIEELLYEGAEYWGFGDPRPTYEEVEQQIFDFASETDASAVEERTYYFEGGAQVTYTSWIVKEDGGDHA